MFETTADAYATLCLALMQKIAVRKVGPLGGELEWAHDLIVPNGDWPPREIARRYFKREWRIQDFSHAAREARNFFQKCPPPHRKSAGRRNRLSASAAISDRQTFHRAAPNDIPAIIVCAF